MPKLGVSENVENGTSSGDMDSFPCGTFRHPVIQWFEQEVKPELSNINLKLDNLLLGKSDSRYDIDSPNGLPKLAQVLGAQTSKDPKRDSSRSLESRLMNVVTARPSVKSCCSNRQGPMQNPFFNEVTPAMTSEDSTVPASKSITKQPSGMRLKESTLSGFSNMTKQEVEAAAARIIYRTRWLTCLDQVWSILEDTESSEVARWFAVFYPIFIVSSVFITLFQAIDPPPLSGVPAAVIETTIDSIFLLEFSIRYVACPNRKIFFCNIYNLVDLAAVIPLFIRAAIGFVLPRGQVETVPQGFLLCAVPLIRLLKTLRRFEKFQLLLKAFSLAAEALPVLLYMLFVITLFFAVVIYLVEPRDNIPSLDRAVWLTIVTMTTVGYGDIVPSSLQGSFITGILIVITVLYMAVPLGIIGNAFTQTWNDRDRILLTHRTRDRLCQWGYGAADIPILFHVSGGHLEEGEQAQGGHLNIDEFRALLKRMRVGFSDERIYQLFKSFDSTNSGTIDDKAFVRTLFPAEYHGIYQAIQTPRRSAHDQAGRQSYQDGIRTSCQSNCLNPIVTPSAPSTSNSALMMIPVTSNSLPSASNSGRWSQQ